MKSVLVVDSTGRGHAICDLFVRTDAQVRVYYGPGCAWVRHPRIRNVPEISLTDVQTVLTFLAETPVDLVFVSHIDALSQGYVDRLRAAGHRVIGPTQDAAALETSKLRGKQFCQRHGIPTAAWAMFTDPARARAYVDAHGTASVVKADGLTPDGDGAVVCKTREQAHAAINLWADTLKENFNVVIEDFLEGEEVSIFALLDGQGHLTFPLARDYKRTHDGERGKNCDGMGSISPHPRAGRRLAFDIETRILRPLVAGLHQEGLDFSGFVYVGAMLTARGLRVIEINARFGDSEAEVVLPSVRSNFGDLCETVLNQRVSTSSLEVDGLSRCSVALTQGPTSAESAGEPLGWPFGEVPIGQTIHGLDHVSDTEAQIFFANVGSNASGEPVTSGGRVLHVVGRGSSLERARQQSYEVSKRIRFRGIRYRTDIGLSGG